MDANFIIDRLNICICVLHLKSRQIVKKLIINTRYSVAIRFYMNIFEHIEKNSGTLL